MLKFFNIIITKTYFVGFFVITSNKIKLSLWKIVTSFVTVFLGFVGHCKNKCLKVWTIFNKEHKVTILPVFVVKIT
jgi:hypothetical protein